MRPCRGRNVASTDEDVWTDEHKLILSCAPFLCPSDLFERQGSDDLNLCDFGGDGHGIDFPWKGGFPGYHGEKIHEKKWEMVEELKRIGDLVFLFNRKSPKT